MRQFLSASLLGLLLSGCAAAAPIGPAPVQGIAVQAWVTHIAAQNVADIYLRNDAKVDHIITNFQLYNCANIRQECINYEPNVLIPAGKTVKAMRLTAELFQEQMRYSYNFRTRPVSQPVAPTPTRVGMGSIPAIELADPERFVARVPAVDGRVTCNGPRPLAPKTTPYMLIMQYIVTRMEDRRSVMVQFDGENRPVQYNDSRGENSNQPGMPGAEKLGGRTAITIRVDAGFGMLINEGDGKPGEYFTVSGPTLLTAQSLGRPADVIAKLLKDCGYQP